LLVAEVHCFVADADAAGAVWCVLQMKALVEMEGSGLVPLLMDDKYEDLGRMYSLFK
jgi:hypothetical protein